MTLEEAIRQRRSVRGFLPREVPDEALRSIFELAQDAPSGCNAQPWLPHIVSGGTLNGLRTELIAAAEGGSPAAPDWPVRSQFSGVYRDRQYDAAAQLFKSMGIARHDLDARRVAALRNFEFFGAPHVAFLFLEQSFGLREAADVGIYAQTLMLAMMAHGVSSCPQGALALYPAVVRKHLRLDDDHKLLFGISFGYEDRTAPANNTRVGRSAVGEAARFYG